MKKLKINRLQFDLAFELSGYETTAYLDSESGEVLFVEQDASSQLDEILTDEETIEAILETLNAQDDLREDEREILIHAAKVDSDGSHRYLMIPKQDSRDGYRDMQEYIESLDDVHLSELLSVAIQGSGAFRRFKNVLFDYPEAENNWFRFCELREHQRMMEWFEEEEIEAEFVEEDI